MLKIFNTLSRQKEEFKPLTPGYVSLYTCGPTVYNYAHIGNLRMYIFEDVLQKTLEFNNYKVKRVMNITDVGHLTSDEDSGEDKIEQEAQKEKKSVWDIAKFYTGWFVKNLRDLNIEIPRLFIPATKTIPEQIKIIKVLFEKGFAYETSRAIYFEVSKFKDYTKLSRQPLIEKITAARDEVVADPEKKHPADFALWFKLVDKFQNHTMQWNSPWGKGFPGWHIECSAISTKYLGQPFDIHTGGIDHISIHHTNEIAQSEAAFDKPMANYWLHGAFLTINKDRMGKSEGNFIRLEDLKNHKFNSLSYRYLVLNAHYRATLDFSWDAMTSAQNAYRGLLKSLALLKKHNAKSLTGEQKIDTEILEFKNIFKESINDDLNTPRALASIYEFINKLNELKNNNHLSKAGALKAYQAIIETDKILALNFNRIAIIPLKIRFYSWLRELYRTNKQFTKSDLLRKKADTLGYIIEDTSIGPVIFPK